MKAINEKFLDTEYNKLSKAKREASMTWHDFIMLLVNAQDNRYCEACKKEMKNE